uniref:NADH-ubiquinone oxidoreductase chain 2 n=1 Tax=Cerion uva TaxID=1108933 RepID=A0A343AZV4_9EUPU|nr:NADH dehydrogenase subunit 2 [Cerion uva]AQL10421.1 NADH dehydrogenase subunit 2 [Cerion uva]
MMVSVMLLGLTIALIFTSMLMTDIILTWLMMEVSMLLFVCWAGITTYNSLTVEGLMLYFLPQSYAGIFMIVVIFWSIYVGSNMSFFLLIATVMLAMKIGLFPFHFWVFPTTLSLDYYVLLVLMTLMKVIPLALSHEIMFMLSKPNQFPSSMTLWTLMAVSSLMAGTVYGLGATSLRHMLAASSIVHGGWLVTGMMSYSMWWYFLGYSVSMWVLISSVYSQKWASAGFYLLALGGLPPFAMFSLKMYVLVKGVMTNVYVELLAVAVVSAVISLFYYLKFSYPYLLKGWLSSSRPSLLSVVLVNLLSSLSLSLVLILDFL